MTNSVQMVEWSPGLNVMARVLSVSCYNKQYRMLMRTKVYNHNGIVEFHPVLSDGQMKITLSSCKMPKIP